MSATTTRPVTESDLDAVVALQAAYYHEDGYPFSEVDAREAWATLIADSSLGRGWVFENEDVLVGYCVLTFGFSLEYRGRDAFVDEIYVSPTCRGEGLGARALALVEAAAAEAGARALHLEVESDNDGAARLYERSGFRSNDRRLLTKRL